MKVSIVVIGDEILLGRVTDTNSGAISRAVDLIGGTTVSVQTVGDNREAIRDAVLRALSAGDVVFTTGGLGPTKDDITKEILREIFGGEIVRNDAVTDNIKLLFADRGLKLNSLTLDQALVPSTAHIIQNRFGTAPIMVFRQDGKALVAMPGVPYETEGMLPEVVDFIHKTITSGLGAIHSTRLVTGLSESAIAGELEAFEDSLSEKYKLAYLPDSPVIKLRLDGPADDGNFARFEEKLDSILNQIQGLTVLSKEDTTLAAEVIKRLREARLTLSTAESCTGGRIASSITSVAGASDIFKGSVVSYANSAKIDVLGVGSETLKTNGAVSRQVVAQMVDGACNILSTDCAVATSGIAGPGGGSPEKPVGTVWIAVKTPRGITTSLHHFSGDRRRVIERATATALILLLGQL